jgi:hypothetical protein
MNRSTARVEVAPLCRTVLGEKADQRALATLARTIDEHDTGIGQGLHDSHAGVPRKNSAQRSLHRANHQLSMA